MQENRYDGTVERSIFDESEIEERFKKALADERNASVTIHKRVPASWRTGTQREDPKAARDRRKSKRKAARAARRKNRR